MGPTPVAALPQGFMLLPSLTAVAPTPIASSPAITLELSLMSLSPASEASILASSLLPMSPSPTSGASVSTSALSPMSPSWASGALIPTPWNSGSGSVITSITTNAYFANSVAVFVSSGWNAPTSGNTPLGGANLIALEGSLANAFIPSVILVNGCFAYGGKSLVTEFDRGSMADQAYWPPLHFSVNHGRLGISFYSSSSWFTS
ncbi:hypothetical protein LguiA_006295 [Lonicera macranthoides]